MLFDAVEFENQRAIYAEDQRKILNGHTKLNEMTNAMAEVECLDVKSCLREKTRIAEIYYQEFNVQGDILKENGP